LGWLAAFSAPARADDVEVIARVTKMNKKAIEEYENLNFEEARKILREALEVCTTNGLDKHPIRARTHIHLGIVIFSGFKQRELALKQFRKALDIQPEIRLTKSLANPEIQQAFDEALAGAGSDPPSLSIGRTRSRPPRSRRRR
jgi:tetratricopeptide (TPR) repeat protein